MIADRWKPIRKALGTRYEHCSLDTFDPADKNPDHAEAKRKALADIRGYMAALRANYRAGKNVLIFGPKGTGKDHLLVGMLRLAVEAGANCRWWDGLTLYGELFRLWREKQSDGPLLTKLIEADIFAISDPVPPKGAAVNEAIAAALFRIVDGRYRRQRPTWVTANISNRHEGEERLAPQIYDRLRDGALALQCNWESYRRPDS